MYFRKTLCEQYKNYFVLYIYWGHIWHLIPKWNFINFAFSIVLYTFTFSPLNIYLLTNTYSFSRKGFNFMQYFRLFQIPFIHRNFYFSNWTKANQLSCCLPVWMFLLCLRRIFGSQQFSPVLHSPLFSQNQSQHRATTHNNTANYTLYYTYTVSQHWSILNFYSTKEASFFFITFL